MIYLKCVLPRMKPISIRLYAGTYWYVKEVTLAGLLSGTKIIPSIFKRLCIEFDSTSLFTANGLYIICIFSAPTGRLKHHFTGAGIQHFTGEALARFSLPLRTCSGNENIAIVIRQPGREYATTGDDRSG